MVVVVASTPHVKSETHGPLRTEWKKRGGGGGGRYKTTFFLSRLATVATTTIFPLLLPTRVRHSPRFGRPFGHAQSPRRVRPFVPLPPHSVTPLRGVASGDRRAKEEEEEEAGLFNRRKRKEVWAV